MAPNDQFPGNPPPYGPPPGNPGPGHRPPQYGPPEPTRPLPYDSDPTRPLSPGQTPSYGGPEPTRPLPYGQAPQPPPGPAARKRNPVPIVIAVVGLLVVVGLVVGGRFLFSGGTPQAAPPAPATVPTSSAPSSYLSAAQQAIVALAPSGLVDEQGCAGALEEARGDLAEDAVRCPVTRTNGTVESLYIAQYADVDTLQQAFGTVAGTSGTGEQCPTSPSDPGIAGTWSSGSIYCYYYSDELGRFTWTVDASALAFVARALPGRTPADLYGWFTLEVPDAAAEPSGGSAFSVAALEAKLTEVLEASAVSCTGPDTPPAGATYDCSATVPEGTLPVTVTATDASGSAFSYTGAAEFGSVSRTVSGNFSL